MTRPAVTPTGRTRAERAAVRGAVYLEMAPQPDRAWSGEDLASALRKIATRAEIERAIDALRKDKRVEIVTRGKRLGPPSTWRAVRREEAAS